MSDSIDVNSLVSLLKPLDSNMLTNAKWEELAAVDLSDDRKLSSALRKFILPENESMDVQSRDSSMRLLVLHSRRQISGTALCSIGWN